MRTPTAKMVNMYRLLIWAAGLTVAFFVLTGCSAQWHIQRAVLKDPSVLENREIRLDTVVITKPVIARDTLVLQEYDTIENVVNGIEYRIIRRVDTFQIDIECPPDTVEIEIIKNIPQVKYIPLTWWQKNRWWIFLLVAVGLVVYIAAKGQFKYIKKGLNKYF